MADDAVNGRDDAGPDDDLVAGERESTDVVVRPLAERSLVGWRERALAVRAAVPQLARNPVVVGASAAVATVALRVAVDVARQMVGGSAASRSQTLTVSGTLLHEVHVVRDVHVIHHVVHHWPYDPLAYWSLSAPPRR